MSNTITLVKLMGEKCYLIRILNAFPILLVGLPFQNNFLKMFSSLNELFKSFALFFHLLAVLFYELFIYVLDH